jgi:hypothetical protein
MSLINDALKKAARLRAEEQAGMAPPMPGGGHGRVSRQREPIRTQTIILIGAAAVALIVVSAVITGILVTAKPEPKEALAAKPAPAAVPTPAPQKVVVQAPVISVNVPRPAAAQPTPAPTLPARAAEAPPVARAVEPAAAAPAASTPQARNELVQGIVDRFHVSGARAAGADSKALIDGHVYRVNDVMDKSVGLRLSKVDADRLTFVDADGNTYTKTF